MAVVLAKSPIIWIAWEKQRRATWLAKAAGAELHQLECRLPRLLRYLWLSILTFRLLPQCRNRTVVVVTPCLLLCVKMVLLKRWIKPAQIIVDAHTPIKAYKGIEKALYDYLTRMVYRQVHLVMVTNHDLVRVMSRSHPRTKFYVLPDKIPEFTPKRNGSPTSPSVLSICTFAEDEPYREVFAAARVLADVTFIVTGTKKKICKTLDEALPANVRLTGYLNDADYVALLFAVDVIMDLTTVEHCMVCGAYEAVAAGKPLILSEQKVLRDYFDQGTVFTKNHADSICRSIKTALADQERLCKDMVSLRSRRNIEWQQRWLDFVSLLQGQHVHK